MKKSVVFLLILALLGGAGWVVVAYYPYIFARTVIGPVEAIHKLEPMTSVLATRGVLPSQLFSFSVAVRDHKTREIYTSSTEDRAWATIEKGHCVEARFFPHPPWNFEKSGTFERARMERRFDCPADMVSPAN